MHELSVTRELLDIAINKAEEAGAKRINQISLVIGDMTTVIDDCIQFYFDLISQNTIAQGAKLSFQRVPIQVKCRQCNNIFKPEAESWKCPHCSELDAEIINGREFYIDSLDVE